MTKCIAFLENQRQLSPMVLWGNNFPWVDGFKHLGSSIVNRSDYAKYDIKIRTATFITKNIEFNQEFYFTYPETKFKVDEIKRFLNFYLK